MLAKTVLTRHGPVQVTVDRNAPQIEVREHAITVEAAVGARTAELLMGATDTA